MPAGLQDWLAIGIVAAVAALALWRWLRRRRRAAGDGACSNCDARGAAPPAKTTPLRFYRRRP